MSRKKKVHNLKEGDRVIVGPTVWQVIRLPFRVGYGVMRVAWMVTIKAGDIVSYVFTSNDDDEFEASE